MREPRISTLGAAALQQLLSQLFASQARDIAMRVKLGSAEPPDPTHWVQATAESVKPLLLRLATAGHQQMRDKLGSSPQPISSLLTGGSRVLPIHSAFGASTSENGTFPADESNIEYNVLRRSWIEPVDGRVGVKNFSPARTVEKAIPMAAFAFGSVHPAVLDAVDNASFTLARSTMATATDKLRVAMRRLRTALREGLSQAEGISELAKRISEIFASPSRAFAIAATEASRAVHTGQILAAKQAGVRKKEWVASSDACELCIAIMERGPVGIDDPFHVDSKGGPYAVCMHPPVHPHDMCTWAEVF